MPDNWQENQTLEFKYEGTKYEVNVPPGQVRQFVPLRLHPLCLVALSLCQSIFIIDHHATRKLLPMVVFADGGV